MENEIEEKLEEIYNFRIDVKFRDFGIYDVFCVIDSYKKFSVVCNYNAKKTFDFNIYDITLKIDKAITSFYKRGVV